jgi:PTS system mannose-specific IIA component
VIGLVTVTHLNLGAEVIRAAEFILGKLPRVGVVAIDQQSAPEDIKTEISDAVSGVDDGQGVLILTDMFGGTPANLSLVFLEPGRVEVLTGINLPMVIKLAEMRDKYPLAELAARVRDYGRRSISIAGEILTKDAGDQ